MSNDTHPKVSKGAAWSAADFWLQQVSQLLTFVVVGNIVGPGAIGVMALALFFVMFMSAFFVEGMSDALVQRETITPRQVDTMFWALTGAALFATVVIVVAAPWIANGLDAFGSAAWQQSAKSIDDLEKAMIVLGLSLPFMAAGSSLQALLRRDLQFKPLAVRSMIAFGGGFVLAIALALSGFEIEALTYSFLATRIADTVLLLIVSKHRPHFRWSNEDMAEIWTFGLHRTGNQLVGFFIFQIDKAVIGFFLGPVALGIFQIADRIVNAFLNGIAGVLSRVALPVFSRLREDKPAFEMQFADFVTYANLIAFPVFVGLALTGNEIIRLLFNPEWAATGALIAIICLRQLVLPTNYIMAAGVNALGKPEVITRLSIIVLVLRFGGSLIAIPYGLQAVALSGAIVMALGLPLAMAMTGRHLGHRWKYFLEGSTGPLLACLAMAPAVWAAGELGLMIALPVAVLLALKIVAGAVSYAGVLYVVDRKLVGGVLEFVRNRKVAGTGA